MPEGPLGLSEFISYELRRHLDWPTRHALAATCKSMHSWLLVPTAPTWRMVARYPHWYGPWPENQQPVKIYTMSKLLEHTAELGYFDLFMYWKDLVPAFTFKKQKTMVPVLTRFLAKALRQNRLDQLGEICRQVWQRTPGIADDGSKYVDWWACRRVVIHCAQTYESVAAVICQLRRFARMSTEWMAETIQEGNNIVLYDYLRTVHGWPVPVSLTLDIMSQNESTPISRYVLAAPGDRLPGFVPDDTFFALDRLLHRFSRESWAPRFLQALCDMYTLAKPAPAFLKLVSQLPAYDGRPLYILLPSIAMCGQQCWRYSYAHAKGTRRYVRCVMALLRMLPPADLVRLLQKREDDHNDIVALIWHSAAIHTPDLGRETWRVLHAYLPFTYFDYIPSCWQAFNATPNVGYQMNTHLVLDPYTLTSWFATVPLFHLCLACDERFYNAMVRACPHPRIPYTPLSDDVARAALNLLPSSGLRGVDFFQTLLTHGRANASRPQLEPLASIVAQRIIAEHREPLCPGLDKERGQQSIRDYFS